MLPARRGCGSFRTSGAKTSHRRLQRSLDWTGRAGGFGLPGQRTTHHWTSPHGATWKPWCTHHQLILKRILFSVSLRQLQPSSRNLAFLSAHENLYCDVVFFVLRPVADRLDISFKLVTNTTYAEGFSACLNSELSQTHSDGQWHRKDARPTYSCLTMNRCFSLSYHHKKFGHKVWA
jgi:hypothetical protein